MTQTPEEIALFLIRQNAQNREENLALADLWLTALPDELWELTHLKELNLYCNKLASLPQKIGQLHNLSHLDLSYNQLASLPPEIGQLTNLIELQLSSNQLTSLPPEIGQLIKLNNLYIIGNKLTSLPPEIGRLVNLTSLFLQHNRLSSLPSDFGQLQSLVTLYLSYNQINVLPPEISQLASLLILDFHHNHLTSLPCEFVKLDSVTEITYHNNPLEIAIPEKWRNQESIWKVDNNKLNIIYPAQEIFAHYKRMYEEGGRPLGEARVLVVGEGGVGKTSIVKRLIDNAFDDKEDTTLIVEKRPLPLGDVRAQVWDFGGQEHMHATHQFFFSGRSLYLLVFDTRGSLEQNKVEYWLTLINAYSQNAPVILVGNKCDQHEMDIEKRRLREKYPNIRGFIGTSASTGEHIEELRQKIQEEVRAMPQVRVLFSADYLAVKDEMENFDKPHISHEQFIEICERHGVSDQKDQDTLLDLLHDLGTVLYFRDADGNPLLPALGVLNPNWVTRGVYLIVTNPALKDKFKGRLTMSLLREILSAPEYSRHIEDIAKLLERFELCYRADDSSYWLPSLMAKEIDENLGDLKSSAMKFEYGYPELPKSVIVRFIVKTHTRILDNKVWRSGVVLKLDGNTALVQADEEDKRISIFISGEESTRRDALAILRAHFDDIHTMFTAPPESFIYPPQYSKVQLRFDKMKNLLKTGTIQIPEMNGDNPVTINLRELLDGFVTPQERRKDEEKEEREYMKKEHTQVINYNAPVIYGGVEGNNVSVGNNNQITQTISNANVAPELKENLLQLVEAVKAMQASMPDESASEVEDDMKRLAEEAIKPKPNKKWYSVSIEGLIQAAKNLNELGTPVISLAGKVLKLLNSLP